MHNIMIDYYETLWVNAYAGFTLIRGIPLLVDTVQNNTLAKGYAVVFFPATPTRLPPIFVCPTISLSVFVCFVERQAVCTRLSVSPGTA